MRGGGEVISAAAGSLSPKKLGGAIQRAIGVLPSEIGNTSEVKLKFPLASEYNISKNVGGVGVGGIEGIYGL